MIGSTVKIHNIISFLMHTNDECLNSKNWHILFDLTILFLGIGPTTNLYGKIIFFAIMFIAVK